MSGALLLSLVLVHTYCQKIDSSAAPPPTSFECMQVEKGVLECEIAPGDIREYENSDLRVLDTGSAAFWLDACGVLFLTLMAGLMSGMTIGLMGLDLTNLDILSKSGTESQQSQARKIIPLLQKHHWLLVTLLLMNAIVNEALPILLERLVRPVVAVAMGVTLILLFGEIIPQALCSRWGLAIGASLYWFMWLLIGICTPIAWPISKLLDFLIGTNEGIHMFKRTELKELVNLHGVQNFLDPKEEEEGDSKHHQHEDALSLEEINIIKGALDLKHKTVLHRITPLRRCFMLSTEDYLDRPLLEKILAVGHSRIPVYYQNREYIKGVILVKTLINLRRDQATPVSNLPLQIIPTVPANTELYHMLNMFQTGSCHMAIIVDESDHLRPLGIITLDDVIDELIQDHVEDAIERMKKKKNDSDEEEEEEEDNKHIKLTFNEDDDIELEELSSDEVKIALYPKHRTSTTKRRRSQSTITSTSTASTNLLQPQKATSSTTQESSEETEGPSPNRLRRLLVSLEEELPSEIQ